MALLYCKPTQACCNSMVGACMQPNLIEFSGVAHLCMHMRHLQGRGPENNFQAEHVRPKAVFGHADCIDDRLAYQLYLACCCQESQLTLDHSCSPATALIRSHLQGQGSRDRTMSFTRESRAVCKASTSGSSFVAVRPAHVLYSRSQCSAPIRAPVLFSSPFAAPERVGSSISDCKRSALRALTTSSQGSTDDGDISIADLQVQLAVAVKAEDYAAAARIKDALS